MGRWRSVLALLLLAAATAACAVPGTGRPPADAATLAVFDVGQALAVGLVTPDGHALLYDAGNSREDAEAVILPFFRAHGIARLDYLVLSHPDQDHVGGMPAILEAIDVGTFVDPVLPSTNRAYLETLRLVRARRIAAVRAERGRTLALGAAVRATVLWPERPFLTEPDGTISDNDNSVVLRIEHGAVRILVPGDLEARGEVALVAREDGALRAAILVVGHHGSRTSSSEAFLEAVRPAVAIVSAGRNNPYGHPHPETLQRFRTFGAQVYRTDVDGTILVRSDGTSWVLVTGQGRS
ncbi:MAG: ComEC/Rec2 family competence protein [Thermomicrobium sp.]|nr:MBL fold metallo-hydrolase [Thermomicrobium sp.]MDW8059546.1 ComEC/Rec2 family competence protein [Thermomicrobium sp.]